MILAGGVTYPSGWRELGLISCAKISDNDLLASSILVLILVMSDLISLLTFLCTKKNNLNQRYAIHMLIIYQINATP